MKKPIAVIGLLLGLLLALTGCTSSSGAGSDEDTINIVGFAVPEVAPFLLTSSWREKKQYHAAPLSAALRARCQAYQI